MVEWWEILKATVITYSLFVVLLSGFVLGECAYLSIGGWAGAIIGAMIFFAVSIIGITLAKLTAEEKFFKLRVVLGVFFTAFVPLVFALKGLLGTPGGIIFYALYLMGLPFYLYPSDE